MIALRGMDPSVREAAEYAHQVADYYRVPVTVTSVYRSWESQARLRRRYESCLERGVFGRERGCMFPANRPGDSAHGYGLAWDTHVDPAYQEWWDYVRSAIGFRVPPNDRIHGELPQWRTYVR